MDSELRRTGIGGSDVAAVLGLSPWRTPMQVWMEKTGRESFEPDEQSRERMAWGTRLEDVVARHYAEHNAVQIRRINQTIRRPDAPIVMGHVDRAVCMPGTQARWNSGLAAITGATSILEVKTASARALESGEWGDTGSDVVPVYYWLQVQWYMGIGKVERADVATLFGGQHYREYRVQFDEQAFLGVVKRATQWWERHVVADVPPPPMSAEDVARLYPRDTGARVIAPSEIEDAVREALKLKAQIDGLTQRYDELADKIKIAIGEASELVDAAGRTLATWRAPKPMRVTDWQRVAKIAGATEEIISYCSRERIASRRFLLKEINQ